MKDIISIAARETMTEKEKVIEIKKEIQDAIKQMEPQSLDKAVASVSFSPMEKRYIATIKIPI